MDSSNCAGRSARFVNHLNMPRTDLGVSLASIWDDRVNSALPFIAFPAPKDRDFLGAVRKAVRNLIDGPNIPSSDVRLHLPDLMIQSCKVGFGGGAMPVEFSRVDGPPVGRGEMLARILSNMERR